MTGARTCFLDRLRVVLTALVILHHTAITYGGSGGWFYREVQDSGAPSSVLLTAFCAVNQSFFMGLFFLIAGYFTPGSWARKGVRRFVQDRLVRLGVPLLVFGFVLGPLTVALAATPAGESVVSAWGRAWAQGRFVIGPLWFAWALLLFSLVFAVWRLVRAEPSSDAERALPPSSAWLVAALAVGAAALALRQVVPVGQNVLGLQLGYFASYVFLFALGCSAWRYRWLERIDRRQAVRWGWIALATGPWLFGVAAWSGALQGQPVDFNGGLGLPAVVYAFWEPFVAWGMIALLLWIFRERFNAPSRAWQGWGAQAYGAFILHAPVLVGMSVLLADWPLAPLLKFALVGIGSTVLSFLGTAALIRIPGVQRVI